MAEPLPRHLLIPFAGRGSPACRAALPSLRLPNLESLLSRLSLVETATQDESTRSPPHERALAAALGISAADGCIPWAALEARQIGIAEPGDREGWGLVSLCNWQVGIDDVVLGDPAAIEIDAAESAALLAAAHPFFEEDGIALHPSSTPGRWLARARIFNGLATASIDRAVGHPISQWSPLAEAARPLRRLQNEMQMLLYTQRVNDERAARGVPPINSFWLSGTGALQADPAPANPAPTVSDALRVAALRDDGPGWAQAWQALDAGPVADLLADYTAGADITLTLCGDRAAQRYAVQQRGLVGWAKSLFDRPRAANVLEGL
ncbi:hypothetical protein V9K97_19440 [Variovorax sp. CCNWLW186]|jgi:hypothetical protein|uniref:hypothetical protein n=1 Tax=Variovorax sp. CCNWLW186 TaxID=3127473 RepID=UPI003078552F